MGYWFWMLLKVIFYIPFRLIFWTRVINRKELKQHRRKGVMFVCNHKSYIDGPAMWFLFHRKMNFPVKEGVVKKGFWRWLFVGLKLFPVRRGQDLALIRHCMGKLKDNEGVFFFPEGRRISGTEDGLALRNGAAMIAIKAGVPIVPMVMKRSPRPFVFNAIKIGTTISTERYQGKKMEKDDLNELSGLIHEQMTGLLDGFEVKCKPKKWEIAEPSKTRGICFIDGKLLVIKRVKNGKTYYVLPGGHVDEGESFKESVEREIKEETNIDCEQKHLLYKHNMKRLPSKDSNPRALGWTNYYSCSYLSGNVGATDAEEYTDEFVPQRGTYEPMAVSVDKLKDLELRPKEIKEQLMKDIERYGIALTRATKYVK